MPLPMHVAEPLREVERRLRTRSWGDGSVASEDRAGVVRAGRSLELVPPALLLDAIVFGSGCAIVDRAEPA